MNIIEGYINYKGDMVLSIINLEQEQLKKEREKDNEYLRETK